MSKSSNLWVQSMIEMSCIQVPCIGIALGTAVICPGIAMAAVIPEKVHFEPGPEALKVSAELSREPSLIAVSWIKLYDGVALEF